jgi:hypothetical protein
MAATLRDKCRWRLFKTFLEENFHREKRRSRANEHEKRATNNNMECVFVEENAKQFYAMRSAKESKKRRKVIGTLRDCQGFFFLVFVAFDSRLFACALHFMREHWKFTDIFDGIEMRLLIHDFVVN